MVKLLQFKKWRFSIQSLFAESNSFHMVQTGVILYLASRSIDLI